LVLAWISSLLLPSGFATDAFTVSDIVKRYDSVEAQTVVVEEWKRHTNDNGSLAWNTSYVLNSYVDMFEVTSNPKYLDKFVALADPIVAGTDEERGLRDYKGRARVGWGSVTYSGKQQRVVWLAHTGMITYPLARFAILVHKTPALGNYSAKAHSYGRVSEVALKEFDSQWRYDPASGEGFYTFEKDQPDYESIAGAEMPMPFNMELAAGRAFIVLSKLTGQESYQRKVQALAKHFKSHLQTDTSGAYIWTYWFDKGLLRSTSVEDSSHGAIDVEFAVLASQSGASLRADDLRRFVQSFFRYYRREWALGKERSKVSTQDPYALSRWIALSSADCSVYRAVSADILAETGSYNALHLLALSGLAKYFPICS
jgi:hypothetical protein